MIKSICGDCRTELIKFESNYFHSCITDPPYGQNMEIWDKSIPDSSLWKEVYRVLRPGAFCLSFCSPQLYHRLACNIETAGFRIIDMIIWMNTTKLPKPTRLKSIHEPIVVSQKPYEHSIKYNEEKWGCGKINVDENRIPWDKYPKNNNVAKGYDRIIFGSKRNTKGGSKEFGTTPANPLGRYPTNIIGTGFGDYQKYVYSPRVSKQEKGEYNTHLTVKPIDVMRWLVRLFSNKGHIIIDPFMGTGTTGISCLREERDFVGIEIEQKYIDIFERRLIKENNVIDFFN